MTSPERDRQTTASESTARSTAAWDDLRAIQNRALQLAIDDRPLSETLDELVRAVEAGSIAGMLGSILLLDEAGEHLLHGAAPSLPDAYNEAINGIAIGESVGSCGTAAATNAAVFVADIDTDPLWIDFRELALAHGLRACWSTPFRDSEGRVLGTFAMYYPEPREPSQADLDIVELIARSAALIVQRKRSETALNESEARFRNMADNAPVMMWVTDEAGACTYLNRAWFEFTGQSKAEAAGFGWLDATHPDDKPRAEQIFLETNAARQPFRLEYRLRFNDGGYRWAIDAAAPRFSDDGSFMGYIGSVIDIEDRREVEERLRATEERYRLAAKATNDAIWDWHFESGHVLWNEAIETAYGHPMAELDSSPDWWIAHIHPEDAGRIDRSIHDAIDGGADSWSDEYRFQRADGSYAVVFDRGHIIRTHDGRAVRMIGAMLDLTEQRRAEETRLFNEERLRLATEAAEVGFWDVDPINDILTWPPVVKAMFGISPDAPVSMVDFYEGLHPDDRGATGEAYAAACDPKLRALYDVEYRTVGKEDGVIRWVAAKGRGIFDGHNRCVRVLGTAIDVTERKRAEAELKSLNETLEHRVTQVVAEREEAQEALRQSQKMEAVGQLTGGIAHDFNNMLAVVIGSLDLLSRRLGDTDARSKRYLDAAAEGARRAATLTQRLLAFSRQQPLKPETLNANRLVSGMSELLQHALGTDIRLETVLGAGLWRVHADPNQLESVILNLAVNARDAMPDGGRLTIETQNGHLDERYASANFGVPPGQYVVIAVSDTGSGMSPEIIAKAFDPFFTTKDVGKGTGLGLSQVYGFVKQSGGHVKIYSEVGEGTTIRVYLPRYVGAEEELADQSTDEDLPLGEAQEVILVVEDEPAVRQFSCDALTELGYRVLEADGAASALRHLEAHPDIALLFTDIVMPDVNGRKLADEARRKRPDLKVLFTTGYTRNAVVHNGILDPGVELISKPYSIEQLAAKVRSVLES